MMRVTYAGGSFLTGDALAASLIDYAAVLARVGQADRVSVPGIGEDDRVTRFELLLGPASQLIAEAVEFGGEELEDGALLEELLMRGRRARAGRMGEPDPGPES